MKIVIQNAKIMLPDMPKKHMEYDDFISDEKLTEKRNYLY